LIFEPVNGKKESDEDKHQLHISPFRERLVSSQQLCEAPSHEKGKGRWDLI